MKTMLTIMILAALCATAHAGIEWNWTNGGTGTEQGVFLTDGTMTGGIAPAGTYRILDARVTASAYPLPLGSISDGTYYNTQPEMGFDWDGAAPIVFWRMSGLYTNGINLHVTTPVGTAPDRLAMNIEFFIVDYDEAATFLEESLTPVLSPVGNLVVQETSSFGDIKMLFR